jgi:hypothetical protein
MPNLMDIVDATISQIQHPQCEQGPLPCTDELAEIGAAIAAYVVPYNDVPIPVAEFCRAVMVAFIVGLRAGRTMSEVELLDAAFKERD